MAVVFPRILFRFAIPLFSLFLLSLAATTLPAQEMDWPAYPLKGHDLTRGPGHYFAWWKLLLIGVMFLIWVKTTDWINRDTQLLKLDHQLWNPVNFFPFLIVLLAVTLTLPFPIGFSALVLAWLVPLGVFIFQRNANVEEHEKVLTVDHFRHLIATGGRSMGMDINTEKKAAHEKGAPVDLTAISGPSDSKNQANMILARQSEGYVATKDLIADAIDQRGMKIMLDTDSEQVTIRYQVDGVWHEADPMEREVGDLVVEVFKHLSDADASERRKRQEGQFAIKYNNDKCTASLVSQGTKTGERSVVSFVREGIPYQDLGEAGMRNKLQEQLKEKLAEPKGILLFSSMPGGGLSTTVALAGKMSDRYMRDFTSFQSESNPEPVAENISIEAYDDKASVVEQLQTLFRKDPDVVIVHDLVDKEVLELVCKNASQKLVMTTARAKEAVEALLRVLLLKVPATTVAPLLLSVVNQRLVRKLCEECKEEFVPSPQLLKKLGIPAGRVEHLYQPPTDEEAPICKACGGIGYVGRTSIFELLEVNDSIREALIKKPKLDVLRMVAKKSGHRTLQDEGILLVAQGITSIAELSRVLKS